MTEQNDPLMSLVSDDAQNLDREKIATFLQPFITFDKDSKEIVFSDQFTELKSNLLKLKVVFLASKVKSLLFDEDEGFIPKELIALEIMPEGSIKGVVKQLFDSKIIKKNSEGKYYLPDYQVGKIINNK